MEIFKDEITGYEYVDFEDVLDEGIEIDETTKLLINGMINDYLHNLMRKFISFNCVLSDLRSTKFRHLSTHDENVVNIYRFRELHSDLWSEYEDFKEKTGYWKYIDNFTMEDVYLNSFPCEDLTLSDIFEDKDFYQNITKLWEKITI